ncbi:NfeD family protein [Parvularcula lutaonensis]|uniref:NfeD family protein n=1 Tax=Parvularcula lutaonensis TaxID=491923 RepID=A0ABV7M874_9PROT|nr:NfeD family protein [Parvularcula lutaonensis]GGY43999.1 membrane protein [Parvularcula lutaonensis]
MELLLDPPFWAWFVLAGILLILELMTGTFYLLWPAAAAGLTGLATRAPFTPSGAGEWLLFAVLTVVLTLAARAMGLKRRPSPDDTRPFNRADSRVGQHARAIAAFEAGRGRVRLGDTDWQARSPVPVAAGDDVVITDVDGSVLVVAPAGTQTQ